ncbi:MAG: thiamine phosphate synthase [Alphaproteobacteria bacterium]|nr:thiamine phosphate synthase [Alphaproteobacteria bacterium]
MRAFPAGGGRLPVLFFFSDGARVGDPIAVAEALPGGVGFVLRDYERRDRACLAEGLARRCRARGIPFLVAGDPELARRVGADGVHLPGWRMGDWRRSDARGLRLVTASAHTGTELRRARAARVDAIFLSPVFATASHPGAEGLGLHRAAALMRLAGGRVLALGGVDPARARRLAALGFAGAGVIGALLAPSQPPPDGR